MTDSIYDQLNAYGTVAKQRFVENFSGSALDTDRWNLSGGGTAVMQNSVDGGLLIQSTTGSNNKTSINFNNINQYSHTGCVLIAVARQSNTTWYTGNVGMSNTAVNFATDIAEFETNNPFNTYVKARSADASTASATDTVMQSDQTWKNMKMELTSSNILYTSNGVLDVTKTTNRPTASLQPEVGAQQGSSKVGDQQIRYMECYNT
tara:strand:- start:642 stop:1259 length:618 start_codon:yes stop_codon:yes gene_type:complete